MHHADPSLDPRWEDDGKLKIGGRRVSLLSDQLDLFAAPEVGDAEDSSPEPDTLTPAQRKRLLRAAAMKIVREAGFSQRQTAAAFGVSHAVAGDILAGKQKLLRTYLKSRRPAPCPARPPSS